jgi:hypothetical protein
MSSTDKDRDLNPRELKQRVADEQGDGGLVDGEPGAGTDANYSAPPPKLKSTAVEDTPPGGLEQTGGDGTAPTVVK